MSNFAEITTLKFSDKRNGEGGGVGKLGLAFKGDSENLMRRQRSQCSQEAQFGFLLQKSWHQGLNKGSEYTVVVVNT